MYPLNRGHAWMVGCIDSALKALEAEGVGLALRGLAILLCGDIAKQQPVFTAGQAVEVNLLEWLVRRLRRVGRSTFAACRLNALIDNIETLLLTQLALHQVYCGTKKTAEQLLQKLEIGGLYPPIELLVDARIVSDSVAALDI